MNRIVRQFEKAFDAIGKKKGWDKIYVGVDIHETMMLPTWSVEMSTEYYPFAEDVLRFMSEDSKICMILWSCSLPELNKVYHSNFKDKNITFDYINCNPECKSTQYADFDTKLYFNVGLDDKFGFIPTKDWPALHKYFFKRKMREEGKNNFLWLRYLWYRFSNFTA